jgi:eukaryotic-like serine/threonine-protein kinase
MSANANDPLLSAAAQISDGVPVDWANLQEQIATPDQAAVVEELKSLERFARINEEVPTRWGRFSIIEEIGRGMFGTVYRAIDTTLQLEVALKVIRSRIPETSIDPAKALDEARRLVKVRHTNVVRAYGTEQIGSEVALSMELIKGRTLDELVTRQATFSANEAAVIGLDLCRALAAVHAAGILHGDIKAHNVMREDGGRTVLMDFGTGRELRREPAAAGGDFAGTPLYLAPEVFAGQNRSTASDIYSIGIVLYFLVTGSYPVDGETRTEIGRQHNHQGPRRSLRDVRPDLPDGFIRIVERAIDTNPAHRYDSAGALESALCQFLAAAVPAPHPDPLPRWKGFAVLAAATVFIVGSGGLIGYRVLNPITADPDGPTLQTPTSGIASGAAGAALPSRADSPYRIKAAFYRETNGVIERLMPGSTVAPGDALSLQIETTTPAFVYVVNEDEQGESYLLFPLPGSTMSNPLLPGGRHRLPGVYSGDLISWEISSAGKQEHFLIIASPERSQSFEEIFATLPQPTFGKPPRNAKLTTETREILRGVGGLTASPVKADRQLRLLPEFSKTLPADEETIRGVWIRQATFPNRGK